MSKIWLHSTEQESVLVELDGEKYHSLLESGEFSLKRGVKTKKPVIDLSTFTYDELEELADRIEDRLDELEPLALPLEEMSDDELRSLAKEAKIPGYHNMKRENLLIKLKGE